VQQLAEKIAAPRLEQLVLQERLQLPVQRGGLLVAEMHFEIAVDLRMRAEDMPRQAGVGAHVAQQEDSGAAVRQGVWKSNLVAIDAARKYIGLSFRRRPESSASNWTPAFAGVTKFKPYSCQINSSVG